MTSNSGGFVAGCGGVESNFLVQLSAGPRRQPPAAEAALLLALHYFTQLEVRPVAALQVWS